MANILDQVRMWAEQIISSMGYVGIALLMFLENIFPPIPSELVMPFAGSLTARGDLNIVGVMIAGTIGAVAGAVAIYYIGVWITDDTARNWFDKHGKWVLMSEDDFDNAMEKFENHGKVMVLIGRLMPTIRSLISLPAGLCEMNLGVFLLYTTIGTVVWNGILAGAGMYMGQNWQQVVSFVDTYSYVFWGIAALLVVIFLVKRAPEYMGRSGKESSEKPREGAG